jgi:hypothetical protein
VQKYCGKFYGDKFAQLPDHPINKAIKQPGHPLQRAVAFCMKE